MPKKYVLKLSVDGGAEVGSELSQQVDVVVAGEAVGQIVAWVHGGEEFAAVGAVEDEASVAEFGRRSVGRVSDGDGPDSIPSRSLVCCPNTLIVRTPANVLARRIEESNPAKDIFARERCGYHAMMEGLRMGQP